MVPNFLNLVCLSILLSLFQPWARAEMFTGIAEMESLLEIHQKIIDDLDDYIMKEEKRLAALKAHLEQYKIEQEQAMEDIPNYLGNPINLFTLMKRLTYGRDEIDRSMQLGTEYIQNVTINRENVMFPTLKDLAGAAQALTFLQFTYKLDVQDMADGMLKGVAYSHPMSAEDCFELCKTLYMMTDYNNSLEWSKVTLRKYKEETTKEHSFTEVEVVEYIAFTYYLIGNLRTALEWTKTLLKLEPNHPRAAGNVPQYEGAIANQDRESKGRGEDWADTFDTEDKDVVLTEPERIKAEEMRKIEEVKKKYEVVKAKYEALCRGDIAIKRDVAKRLFCRYMSETHPFLQLAPIKAEQVYIDPDVFVFHGALSDDEIHVIKVLSMPRLKPTMFFDPNTGKLEVAYYRMSKAAWLHDASSKVVARVSQRVADMTGLSVQSAEDLQVVNYGIGGYYEPHYDFAVKTEGVFEDPDGNRIATVLFYMSDVAQGGATVFTELGLSVFPARGAALYWRNLHPSGDGDTATRHGGCPVLRGFKLVSNKWLHEAGQKLIKPYNYTNEKK